MGPPQLWGGPYTHEQNGQIDIPKVGDIPYTHEQNGQTLTADDQYDEKL